MTLIQTTTESQCGLTQNCYSKLVILNFYNTVTWEEHNGQNDYLMHKSNTSKTYVKRKVFSVSSLTKGNSS